MPAKKSRVPQLGSVSTGTLRTQDLLRSFADELAYYRPRGNARLIREARAVADCVEQDKPLPRLFGDITGMSAEEMGSEIISEISDKLNEIAPDYVWFGAHEGNGADFGFWPVHDAIEELIDFSNFADVRDNDHEGDFRIGDTAVYRRHANGRIVSLLTF